MSDKAPILDLDLVLPDRPTVLIRSQQHPDGKLYELATGDDLSLEDQAHLGKRGEALEKLIAKNRSEIPTPEIAAKLALLLHDMVPRIVLGIEPEVIDQMGPGAKLRLVEAFTQASPGLTVGATETPTTAATPAA